MLLLFHITVALSSIAYTTYLFIAPSKTKFYAAYGLIGLTLASGTYLVVSLHAPLLSSCEAGLTYIGIVLSTLVAARYRWASIREKVDPR